ncbi:phosphocholine-specific phospholipase C [Zavarzinia sp.]|uniref:phosphocholine-specific phospholipase C n=1 Tax=Zavarzinia sp. TaxID=2027920 RepID=UPI0035624725
MTDTNRRNFLKSGAAVAGIAAASTAFPPSIRQALAIQANNATRSIKDVEHVVILMQENRAFDHYFGTYAGVRGFGDRFTIPLPGGLSVYQQTNGTRIVMPYHLDSKAGNAQRVQSVPHTWPDAHQAWDNGRMTAWPTYKKDRSMGYYTEAELDFQFALARAFTVCDAYHAAIHAGTNPNRLFHWTGTNGPTGSGVAIVVNEWDSLGSSKQGHAWTTYAERLQAAGVGWKVYQNLPDNFTDNPLAGFKTFRAASEAVGNIGVLGGFPFIPYQESQDAKAPLYKGVGNTMPKGGMLQEFADDVSAGKLPQVSWIVAPTFYSEHPAVSAPVQGGWYVQQTLAALTANPEVWSKTALIVNFDENDGFFDHVPPPTAYSFNADGSPAGGSTMAVGQMASEYFNHPAPAGTSSQPTPDGQPYGPGPRVPCWVVSPWSKGGYVNSEVFDHTSVLRFLEARFGVKEPNISAYRRAICGDLTSCFDFVNPNAAVPSLPSRTRAKADTIRIAQELSLAVKVPDASAQSAPQQEVGIRPSRALPYVLQVDATVSAASVGLAFANNGKAGAVFHVYDKLHLDRVPRRYMVEAGMSMSARWTPDAGQSSYDLWVLGPNGFHRHFKGDFNLPGGPLQPRPEVACIYNAAAQSIALKLVNRGKTAVTLSLSSNAYESYSLTKTVAAGTSSLIVRSLKGWGNWYDYTVVLGDGTSFSRRLAGRMETGHDSISDPADVMKEIAGT